MYKTVQKSRAFTLIELLVVTSIIALLIAILLPSLSQARAQAKRSVCLANTRSIGNSLQTYMQDWQTLIPFDGPASSNYWVLRLAPYGNTAKIRQCPSANAPNPATADAPGTASLPWSIASTNPTVGTGCYGLNGWFYTTNGASANLFATTILVAPPPSPAEFFTWPLTQNTALIPVLGDCSSALALPRQTDSPPPSKLFLDLGPGTLKTDQLQRYTLNRHLRAINLAFADGHSETVPLPQLSTFRWNTQWTQNQPLEIP